MQVSACIMESRRLLRGRSGAHHLGRRRRHGVWRFEFDIFAGRDRGQALIEYTLIFLLLIFVIFGGLLVFGPQLASIYQNISNSL